MMLDDLIPDIPNLPRVQCRELRIDSRCVAEGDLFLAVPGETVDGRRFIADAINSKASAVLSESPAPTIQGDVPVIEVPGLRSRVGELAAKFYGHPTDRQFVVAVTGTNGKSSCCHFISEALSLTGTECGVIGTLGYGLAGHLQAPGLTTPEPVGLQRRFARLAEMNCEAVALEASSHGLSQDRLAGTKVDVAVFTNITRDHLDYHGDFEQYKREKMRLFDRPDLKLAIVNVDDECGHEFAALAGQHAEVITTSISRGNAQVFATAITQDGKGLKFRMNTPWGQAQVRSSLLGKFNVSNLLSAAAVLGSRGIPVEQIARTLSTIGHVPGRMETITSDGWPTIVIDYAHTPDALEKALLAVKQHCKGEIWCVFGCGGDRDKGKRPLMGEVASRLAAHVMITDDNPRNEKSRAITNDIVKGVVAGSDVEVITDRQLAIRRVVTNAAARDVVLIAGKGHEDYQIVGSEKLAFSDHQVVEQIIGS